MSIRKRVAIGATGIVWALVMVGGCSVVDTGVRVAEGDGGATPAPAPEPPAATTDGEAISVDPVEVLREDAGVRQDVKDLVAQPCSGSEGYGEGWFPLYTTYTTIAGTDIPVVIINVQGCADVVACSGVHASYVYRLWDDRTERIYTPEEPMSEVTATAGELFIQRPIWGPNDTSDCPSGSDMVPLAWNGTELEAESE